MLPPRLQSQGPAAAGIFSERGKRCPVRARSPAEEADRTAAVPLPAPAPAARERPLAEPALPGRLPSSRYRARTQEPRHRAYLKGTQAETPQQDPPCAASWLSTEISQPPAPRARRPAAPGRKMPGSCPSVSAGRRPPLPIRRCTAPPHNLLQPPPPAVPAVPCVRPPPLQPLPGTPAAAFPSAPAPLSRPAPRGATADPRPQVRRGLRGRHRPSSTGTAAAPRSPAEPVAPASRHAEPPRRGLRAGGVPPGGPRAAALIHPRRRVPPPPPPAPLGRRPAVPPGRSPAARRLGGPRYGVPQRGSRRGNARPREARGRARNGAGPRAALEAPAPRISFSPRTRSAPGRQPPPRGGRGGPSPPEFTCGSGGEGPGGGGPASPVHGGAPLGPAGARPSGRAGRGRRGSRCPPPPAACQLNGTPGRRAARRRPPRPGYSLFPRPAAPSAPLTAEDRSRPGRLAAPLPSP